MYCFWFKECSLSYPALVYLINSMLLIGILPLMLSQIFGFHVKLLDSEILFLVSLLDSLFPAPFILLRYQFNQDRYSVEMVALALLKAMMQLPENDFTMISYLVPISRVCTSCTCDVDNCHLSPFRRVRTAFAF